MEPTPSFKADRVGEWSLACDRCNWIGQVYQAEHRPVRGIAGFRCPKCGRKITATGFMLRWLEESR